MKNFWNSLQFRIPLVFIISFLLVLAAIVGVFSTIGKRLLTDHAYAEVVMSGRNIVAELGNRTALAESLATAMANLGEQLPADDELNKRLIEKLIDYEGTEAFIAGGGIWPEPFQYDPSVERRSFFWGRDKAGRLQFYDDYNKPEGPGYHHEEWYVPARHLQEGEAFWSRSYMDPYSYQPMVTVTAPMYRDGEFYGVSTIDLKLEGLQAFLAEVSRNFGGYAFAVDRNGKFLSFPEESLTKLYGTDGQGNRTEEFIYATEFAARQSKFQPLASALQDTVDRSIEQALQAGPFDDALALTIADDSYQIDAAEARLIAAVITTMQQPQLHQTLEPTRLFLEDDLLLGEPAFAAVFEMPRTYWKIVTVMPYSMATSATNLMYRNLVTSIALVMTLSLLLILLFVRKMLVSPISSMSKQLQRLADSSDSAHQQLEIRDRGELGQLAFWFNRRSQKLLEVQRELHAAGEQLEQRVAERTEALRQEIEQRSSEQQIKEQRIARVEQQHEAIIELSLHRSLFTGDVVDAARIINETASRVTGVARCSIWLVDEHKQVLEALDLYRTDSNTHESGLALKLAEYPVYIDALRNDRAVAVSDMSADPRTAEFVAYARKWGVSALLDSPFRVGGKLRGVVCLEQTGEKREWHADEIRFAGEIADQFLQALANAERIRSEEQIRQLAFYDPLTNLANRRLLHETIKHELAAALRHHSYGSLIYLDLDNFKTLNDALGHAVGDELLAQLAERLGSVLRKEDMAARLGGDEFVVLLNGGSESREEAMDQAFNVARKLQNVIGEPYRLHGYEHIISSSMGITIYPEKNSAAGDVLKQADTAMYRAKADGRNRICFYNENMQRAADNRLLLEKELRRAIQNNEFAMYFQPQLDGSGGHVGAEALVRWRHPERGMVTPAEFIPIAEETGLILDIGAWILREVCQFAMECGIDHIAVNISPAQFRQPDFVAHVQDTLARTDADPAVVMFELTEGILIENIEDTIAKMNALKAMGIRIAIDDFGTGYSSLAYLKQLPLDQLKISNDFVVDIDTDRNGEIIVDTIISMARHLGLDVVAEGVETAAQLRFLEQRGCRIFQGFYFSKPLVREDFLEFLRGVSSRKAER
jgi:diguanylate cyclase (GGDEF)-like protein